MAAPGRLLLYTMKQPILLALLGAVLTACQNSDAVIQMQPTLSCPRAIKCYVIEWQLGIRVGPKLGGTHLGCHCVD